MNKKDIFISIVVSIILVGILLSQIDISDILTTLSDISLIWVLFGFFLIFITYFLRALRFKILLNDKLDIKNLFSIVSVHSMFINLLPARTGELSYIYLLKKKNIPSSLGITTLLTARILDLFAIILLFCISIFFISDLPAIILNILLFIALLLILSALLLCVLLYHRGKSIELINVFLKKLKLDKFKIARILIKKLDEIKNVKLLNPRDVIKLLLLSIFAWYIGYLVSWSLLNAMGFYLSPWKVIIASTFLVFITLIPIQGVANFGTYESMWAVTFTILGISKEDSIVTGFSTHIIKILYFMILGIFGFLYITEVSK